LLSAYCKELFLCPWEDVQIILPHFTSGSLSQIAKWLKKFLQRCHQAKVDKNMSRVDPFTNLYPQQIVPTINIIENNVLMSTKNKTVYNIE
jgi:hypothetical protein